MVDVVKSSFDVSIHDPAFLAVPNGAVNSVNGIPAGSPRSEPITGGFKLSFPFGFQSIFHHGL